jgi:molybdate transport system substrate-binding protein
MRRKVSVAVLTLVVALALAAPAFAAGSAKSARTALPTVNVFGAASLRNVFPAMVKAFKQAKPMYNSRKFAFNFQGTDVLTAQIQQGAPCDIFAGASTKYGNVLFSGGFINAPVNFCQNRLIVIMPKSNPAALHTLADLAKPGVMIAIGDAAVPIGTYTRTVLTNLNALYGASYKTSVLADVVSNEVNVAAVVALVEINEVDAGFVYQSDAYSAGTSVRRVVIPAAYQSDPLPTYPIALTKSCKTPIISQRFVNFVRSKAGQKIMTSYAFLPKPAAP